MPKTNPLIIDKKLSRSRKPKAVKEAQALFGVLGKLSGKVEGPADWSKEHDHYLYGTPKHKKDD